MKIRKVHENQEVSNDEITKLFKELKYHDTKHREIDKKLAIICKEKLETYIYRNDLSSFEIKNIFYDFYRNHYSDDPEDKNDTVDFSFEKEMVLMWLNKKLKVKEEAKKYNI
jgi:hypothetical protein